MPVALLVSAWIEIASICSVTNPSVVALLVSAWIEIQLVVYCVAVEIVALLVSAWIEISAVGPYTALPNSRTPRECVD